MESTKQTFKTKHNDEISDIFVKDTDVSVRLQTNDG